MKTSEKPKNDSNHSADESAALVEAAEPAPASKQTASSASQRKRKPSKDKPELETSDGGKTTEERHRERRSNWIWFGTIFGILCIELFIFGSKGHVKVCVGTPSTDFDLIGQKPTPENVLRMPICEDRLNIGMSSHYDEAVDQAHRAACQRATMQKGIKARSSCLAANDGYRKYIVTRRAYPWEKAFIDQLFWFLT